MKASEFETLAPLLREALGSDYTVQHIAGTSTSEQGIQLAGLVSYMGSEKLFNSMFDEIPVGDAATVWAADITQLIKAAFK